MRNSINIFKLLNGETKLFDYSQDEADIFLESIPLSSQKHMIESVARYIDSGYIDLSERMSYLIDTIQTLDSDNLKPGTKIILPSL